MADRPVRQRKQIERLHEIAADDADLNDAKDGGDSDAEEAAAPLTAAKPKANATKSNAAPKQTAADASLYGAVVGQNDLGTRADAFIAKWAEADSTTERQLARKEVLTLLLRLAGAKEEFCANLDAATDFGNEAELKEITDSLVDSSPAASEKQYLVLQPSFEGKASNERVRSRFSDLLRLLVERTGADVLVGEEGLAEFVMDAALPLAACGFQPLRHAAALACTSVITALLDRGAALVTERASILDEVTKQRALAANLKKKAGQGESAVTSKASKDADAQLARLNEQAEAAEVAATKLEQCAGELVNAYVPLRYRDVAAAVRNDTIVALGTLIVAHPETYLTNGYLKYLGWMLNDANAGVRGAALVALKSVYTLAPAVVARSNEFMTRFKGRVADMTRDVDNDVAADAVRLLHASLTADQLTNDEIDVVREALLSDGPSVRAAAAAMLLDFFPAFDDTSDVIAEAGEEMDEEEESGKGRKGKKDAGAAATKSAAAAAERTRRATEQLVSIVEAAAWLLPSTASSSTSDGAVEVSRTVDVMTSGFWSAPRGGVLSDWEAYRSLLLPEEETGRDLTDLHTRAAIRLLYSSAARVMEGVEPVHVRGAGGKVTLSTAPAHREAAATTMSASLAAMLPDLLGLYGTEAEYAVPLASLVCLVRPSVYGSASGARLATGALRQLTRLTSVHTSESALEACASAIGVLCASEQPRCKDARAAASTLVSSLSASVTRLIGKLTGAGDEGDVKKGKSKARGSKGKGKGADEDDEMNGDAAEEAAAGSPSGLARYCAQQVRRLRVLADVVAAGDAEVVFPELSPTAGGNPNALMAALDGLLRDRRELAGLFEAAGSASKEVAVEEALESLSPVLTGEALRLYTAIFSGTVNRVCVRAASAVGGTEEEKGEVESMAGRAVTTRDALLDHVLDFLKLRHPVLLAEYCDQAGVEPGSEDANTHSAISACYPLPLDLPTAERTYILRSRQVAYLSLVRLGQLCAPTSLPGTLPFQLSWSASEMESFIVAMYVNAELDVLSHDLLAEGQDMPGAAAGGGMDDGDEDVDEAMDELTNEIAERDRGAVSSKDIARATAAVRTAAAAGVRTALEHTRADQSLHKLLELALVDPGNDRIGSSIIRRLAEELNEAGPLGVLFSEEYSKRMIDVKRWAELLSSQMRSISDGVKYVVRMVRAGREMAIESKEDATSEELKQHIATTNSAVAQLISISRKQVAGLGKPTNDAVLVVIVRTMFKFAQESLEYSESWPWRAVLLSFIMPYLVIIPPKSQESMFSMFYDQMESHINASLPSGGAEAEQAWDAAQLWWDRISKNSDPNSQMIISSISIKSANGKGSINVAAEAARPWMPAAALQALLKSGSAKKDGVDKVIKLSLRAFTGIESGSSAFAGSSSAVTAPRMDVSAASRASRAAPRGGRTLSVKKGVSQATTQRLMDEEDEEDVTVGRSRNAAWPVLSFVASSTQASHAASQMSDGGRSTGTRRPSGTQASNAARTQVAATGSISRADAMDEDDDDDEAYEEAPASRKSTAAASRSRGSTGALTLPASAPLNKLSGNARARQDLGLDRDTQPDTQPEV